TSLEEQKTVTLQRHTENPQEAAPRPPYPKQNQPYPGRESEMKPRPDYGEHTYRGGNRLSAKKALITGGDSGIGRAVALAFAREGADVLFSYMTEEKADAETTVGLVEAADRRCLALEADLRDRGACDRVVDETVETLSSLDILVNNAGFQMARDDGIDAIDDERLDRVFKTNLYALFWVTRA